MNTSILKKWSLYSFGIVVMSLGIALTIWAKVIGVSPWDSFHLGLTNIMPLNIGQIIQVVGAIAILLGFALGVKPKLGTFLNLLFVGWLINLFLDLFPSNSTYGVEPITFLVFFLGIMLSGIGTGLYIAADAGIGPRDSMMVGLNRKFGMRLGVARTSLEVIVVILAFFLSGPIGVGTIIFSFTIGFFVEKTSFLLNRFSKAKTLSEGNIK